MSLIEFIRLETGGTLFKLIDATKIGYMSNRNVMFEGDKNAIIMAKEDYCFYNVVGFEIATKKSMYVYVK